jgi:hypothetical protein
VKVVLVFSGNELDLGVTNACEVGSVVVVLPKKKTIHVNPMRCSKISMLTPLKHLRKEGNYLQIECGSNRGLEF